MWRCMFRQELEYSVWFQYSSNAKASDNISLNPSHPTFSLYHLLFMRQAN